MYRSLYYNGMGGVVMAAISAIDTALYDIVGQKLGVPVYKLLGGKVRESLPIYANGWTEGIPRTPEALARRTRELVAKGFTGCKFDPFRTDPLNREVTPQELRGAVAQVEAVRAAGRAGLRDRHRCARPVEHQLRTEDHPRAGAVTACPSSRRRCRRRTSRRWRRCSDR